MLAIRSPKFESYLEPLIESCKSIKTSPVKGELRNLVSLYFKDKYTVYPEKALQIILNDMVGQNIPNELKDIMVQEAVIEADEALAFKISLASKMHVS